MASHSGNVGNNCNRPETYYRMHITTTKSPIATCPRPRRLPRRRGSTYLLVVTVAIIVGSISAGALAICQVNRRMSRLEESYDQSGLLAETAIEVFSAKVQYNSNWRTTWSTWQNGVYTPPQSLSAGTISWSLTDPIDQDLTDNPADPVLIYGRGISGNSERIFSLTAFQQGAPIDVLRSAVHGDGEVRILDATICGRGPVSSNTSVKVDLTHLIGDIESPSVDVPNNVTGNLFVPAAQKSMPSSKLFDIYRRFAGTIDFALLPTTANITDMLVSPDYNPTSAVDHNAHGIYYISVPPGETLRINNARIHGTLLVELAGSGSRLKVGNGVLWDSYREDFPSLIVYTANDTNTTVTINCMGTANETIAGINFNPTSSPYFNAADGDTNDNFPASLRGVFHIIRDVVSPQSKTVIQAQNRMTACVIADGKIDIADTSLLEADTHLMTSPILGYTTAGDASNVLYNGNMQSQIAPWFGIDSTTSGGGTKLSLVPMSGDGSNCIKVQNRNSGASGVAQDVTFAIQENWSAYSGSVRVKMAEQNENVVFTLIVETDEEGLLRYSSSASATTGWNQLSFSLYPDYRGELLSAKFVVSTDSTNQDFFIDDAIINEPRTRIPSNLIMIPATWQAEPAAN